MTTLSRAYHWKGDVFMLEYSPYSNVLDITYLDLKVSIYRQGETYLIESDLPWIRQDPSKDIYEAIQKVCQQTKGMAIKGIESRPIRDFFYTSELGSELAWMEE